MVVLLLVVLLVLMVVVRVIVTYYDWQQTEQLVLPVRVFLRLGFFPMFQKIQWNDQNRFFPVMEFL